MEKKIRVTVWNEYLHELESPKIASIYPNGIHNAIADFLRRDERLEVKTATLNQPEHGLSAELLDDTDVLIWWGHTAHHLVDDAIVERAHKRILAGMGFIALHSAHMSKLFMKLCGTSGDLRWRENGDKERLWIIEPNHPIVSGLSEYIEIPHEETYGEHFDIPTPGELIFISWFEGGEVFRSGFTFTRGCGRIFYFRPGHESFPVYYQEEIQKVITNAVHWANPVGYPNIVTGQTKAPEKA